MGTEVLREEGRCRRGLDQALSLLSMSQGAASGQALGLAYKRRAGSWRHEMYGLNARKREEAPQTTAGEARKIGAVLMTVCNAKLSTGEDA